MSMNQIIRELVNEIRSTREFNELKQATTNLEQYKDIKNQIEMLQKRQMELFNSKKPPKEVEHKMKEIEQQFQTLSKHHEVSYMLKSGSNFTKLMNKVYEQIGKALDLELKS